MKKTILVTTLIASFVINTTSLQAAPSKEENVGIMTGALTGAAVAGPVGFFVGAISGVLLGKKVEQANKLEGTTADLVHKQQQNQLMSDRVVELESKLNSRASEAIKAADWITQGLTLNLMFTTNSTELSQNDLKMIERLSSLLGEYPELNIRLDGHADARGNEKSNMQLSENRTKAVENAFSAKGIDSARLRVNSHGEKQSIEIEGNTDSYAMDRRVSINFYTTDKETFAQN